MAIPKIIADFEAQLATAISIGSTSFTLSTATDDDGVALPAGLYYFTVDNGQNNKEYLAGTLSGTSVTGVVNVTRQGVEASGAVRAHRIGASVILTDFATYKKYIDNTSIVGAANATTSLQGLVELPIASEIDSDAATGATGAGLAITPDQLVLSKYYLRLPSAAEKTALSGLTGLTGTVLPYAGRSAPSGYLLCDGSLVSRATYATLFAVISPSQTFTVTIASPGVFSAVGHGLVIGDKIHLTTTGALPTGLAANTDYFVISAGLTADAFEVALVPGGAAVNTTGSQSGVQTMYKANFGKGDGSTTFQLPDMRSKMPLGVAASAPTTTLSFEPGQVNTGTELVTILDTIFPSQGQKVQLTTTGTLPAGLSLATDYWIIRASATTIGFATSLDGSIAGTLINLTTTGSGVHTMTFTNRAETVIGRSGGEENHGISLTELTSHSHPTNIHGGSTVSPHPAGLTTASDTEIVSEAVGGNTPHNNMPPYVALNYIIKT